MARPWKKADEANLRRYYPSASRITVINVCGGRRWDAIRRQAQRLGVRRDARPSTAPRAPRRPYRRWTDADRAYLTAAWGLRAERTVCARLKRTSESVRSEARRLGLSRRSDRVSVKAAARAVGVSPGLLLRVLAAYLPHWRGLPSPRRKALPCPRPTLARQRAGVPGAHRVVALGAAADAWSWWSALETLTQAAERAGVCRVALQRRLARAGERVPRGDRRAPAWWDAFIDQHAIPRVKRGTSSGEARGRT